MVLTRLFSRLGQPAPRVPDGERVYCIGDIHGRHDLLLDLLRRVDGDIRVGDPEHVSHLVFLGDYVDRGPDSAQVVNLLRRLCQRRADTICLRGNHEDTLLNLLEPNPPESLMYSWLEFGGRETLVSYGVPTRLAFSDNIPGLIDATAMAIPAMHQDWLRRTRLSWSIGDYLFVHAGVRPGVALDAQAPHDLMWIREPFLSSKERFDQMIVHGHSIQSQVQERPNRIGIDTGAYVTGRLTALVLEGETRRFLQTDSQPVMPQLSL